MKQQHRTFGLSYGGLYWIRSQGKTIEVPLSILTAEQRERLEEYLTNGDLMHVTKDRARLVWEYANQTDGGYLVTAIALTKEQRESLDPPTRRVAPANYRRVDFPELRAKLLSGAISWTDVIRTFESLPYRPWATREWREERDRRIKTRCSGCGSQSGPMVLQHTRQPRKPRTIIKDYEIRHRDQLNQWLEANPPRINISGLERSADACPHCGSQTIRFRPTLGIWVCVAVSEGVQCGHRFEQPKKQVPRSVVLDLRRAAVQREKERFLEESDLGRQAALDAIGEMIRYLSLEDTKTLCKSCAFVEDRLKQRGRA